MPEGWRAEITEDGITMTPPPSNFHNSIARSVDRALNRALPEPCPLTLETRDFPNA